MREISYRAAGGVVFDDRNRVLLIERDVVREGGALHEVRLPKGKIEPTESDEEAALREVAEETGCLGLEVAHDLGVFDVEYVFKGSLFRRKTHYFLMKARSGELARRNPDKGTEEELFTPRWVGSLSEAARLLTYAEEKDVAAAAEVAMRCL